MDVKNNKQKRVRNLSIKKPVKTFDFITKFLFQNKGNRFILTKHVISEHSKQLFLTIIKSYQRFDCDPLDHNRSNYNEKHRS